MPALDFIKPSVTSVRLISSLHADFKKELKIPKEMNSLGLLTADADDVAYIAADESTKHAQVKVVYGRSLYAGATHAPSPNAGEVIIMLAGPNPGEVKAGIDCFIETVENGPAFQWANDKEDTAFLSYLISQTGTYLSDAAGVPVGTPMAYLIATPLEAAYGIDAALKAAEVELSTYIAPPSETNYSGAFLTGTQAACQAAVNAFTDAVVEVGMMPIKTS